MTRHARRAVPREQVGLRRGEAALGHRIAVGIAAAAYRGAYADTLQRCPVTSAQLLATLVEWWIKRAGRRGAAAVCSGSMTAPAFRVRALADFVGVRKPGGQQHVLALPPDRPCEHLAQLLPRLLT